MRGGVLPGINALPVILMRWPGMATDAIGITSIKFVLFIFCFFVYL